MVYTRLFIFGKKSTLHGLIRSLHDYSFWEILLKNALFCPKQVQNCKNFVSLHAYLGLHDYLISKNCSSYMLSQDSTIIKILRVGIHCPHNVVVFFFIVDLTHIVDQQLCCNNSYQKLIPIGLCCSSSSNIIHHMLWCNGNTANYKTFLW